MSNEVKMKVQVTVEVDVRLMAAIPDGMEAIWEMSEIYDNDAALREGSPDIVENLDLVADFLKSIRNDALSKMFAMDS